ncbi:nitroreductase family protein [Actinomadura rupiterrae]|uniref:nitroreductase family protein n=1 Tax=Actinomadura rupiterrae TaxID=559627 RepID=UPI0020A5D823|nr:nitroreductase family protein [Actinomadura rupiterrae]MCP2340009.1 nitroreductase [Actinomadura rupiterrae]
MEFSEVLPRRRMVRLYRPDPVPEDVLDGVIAVVRRAPSAGFSQGHRVVAVTDAETRTRIAEIANERWYLDRGREPWLSVAPILLVLGVSEDAYHERYRRPDKVNAEGAEMTWPTPYWWVDSGALMMLLQLAAIDAGLASGFAIVHRTDELKELLGMPGDVAVVGIMTLGYPAEPPDGDPADRARLRSMRKPLDHLVRRNRWS